MRRSNFLNFCRLISRPMFCPLTVQPVCTETIILLHGGNCELKFYLINLALFFCSSEACTWVGMASGFVGDSGYRKVFGVFRRFAPGLSGDPGGCGVGFS